MGLVDRIKDWRSIARSVDLIILGSNDRCMQEFDKLREEGVKVIGGGVESSSWERERLKGMRIMKRCGIATPPSQQFDRYEDAIKHVEKTGEAYACKPCWDETDKSLSYVASEPEHLIYMLDDWRKRHGRPKGPLMLQQKVKGIEFAVGAWFGPHGWVPGWEENFEHKKLYAGDIGPNCGEMGTVIRYVRRSKLADRLLKPIEEELHKIGYVGCVDVNCIVDEQGNAWPLEFTNRLGWPAWNISQALLDCDPVEFLHDLAGGSGRGQPFRMNEIAVGVVLAQGDFPYSKVPRETVCGVPIYCKSLDDIHLCQAMLGEAPHMLGDQIIKGPALVSAGDYVLVCSGSGDTVRKARAQAYRAIDGVKMPSSPFHRVDIGNRLRHDIDGLQSHGYATGMEY